MSLIWATCRNCRPISRHWRLWWRSSAVHPTILVLGELGNELRVRVGVQVRVRLGLVSWVENFSTTSADTGFCTRKPSYRWQTRATRKSAKNCSKSTCLQRCRWQYWPIFIRLAVVVSEICEIPRNSLKIQTCKVQGHQRSSILVSMESPYVTSY